MRVENEREAMQLAINEARTTMKEGLGGPFGAAVVNMATREVIAVASNTVLGDHDPTAHAEVNAIRKASKALGTHDLSGHYLVATSEPCPMCLSAIVWANIKVIYYGCTASDAAEIGFRDELIYNAIKGKEASHIASCNICRDSAIELFNEYASTQGTIY